MYMDADLLNKRKEVLREIDKLLVLCKCNSNNSKKTTCVHCKKIEQHGKKLNRLLGKRNNKVLEEYYLFQSDDEQLTFENKANLTVKEYLYYKSKNMLDRDIAKKIGVSPVTLSNWKTKNNIKNPPIRRNRGAMKNVN